MARHRSPRGSTGHRRVSILSRTLGPVAPAVRHFPTASLVLFAAAIGCGHQAVPAPAHGYVTGAGGARIFYQVAGSGHDTIVVVHGGPGAGINDIRPDLEPLADGRVVIFYDQRGGGRSELPKDTTLLTPQYFVGDLESVREHFQLQQMSLLAHSFGAIIVAEYARAHPDRIARMVFLSATGPNRKEAARFYQSQHAT
jgi:proline iminopeptidase